MGKILYDAFSIQNGLKRADGLSPLLSAYLLNMPLGRFNEITKGWN
jgi:hypothetical protein